MLNTDLCVHFSTLTYFLFTTQIPDILSEAAALSISQMEDLMEDEHPVHGDPMLSHNLLISPHSPNSMQHSDLIYADVSACILPRLSDSDSLISDIDMH